jgi:hypothetical protein
MGVGWGSIGGWSNERRLGCIVLASLRVRTDRTGGIHEAFVALASALICMWFFILLGALTYRGFMLDGPSKQDKA